MEEKKETVAVVGASPLKDRYSNQAQTMLEEYGHSPVPVAPKHETIEGKTVYHALSDIPQAIDTVTMYLGPARQDKVIEQIAAFLEARPQVQGRGLLEEQAPKIQQMSPLVG